MPKFKYKFRRSYTITEGFDRVIEAPSQAEADAAASNLASAFNSDCPDDCSEDESGGGGIGDFDADCVSVGYIGGDDTPTYDVITDAPDYVVQADGQCLPEREITDATPNP